MVAFDRIAHHRGRSAARSGQDRKADCIHTPEADSQLVRVTDDVPNGARRAAASSAIANSGSNDRPGTWKQHRIGQQSTSSERHVGMLCGGAGKRKIAWNYLAN
jgi:hypothetical protein